MDTNNSINIGDEQFDRLWGALKEQVRNLRGKHREGIYTRGGIPSVGDRVSVTLPDDDGTARMHVSQNAPFTHAMIRCNAKDLRAIAAQCIAASIEIDEQQ